jgi:hypothetical protein
VTQKAKSNVRLQTTARVAGANPNPKSSFGRVSSCICTTTMKITGATIEELPPKIRPLMEAFRLSPFHVAPERKAELDRLLDKHGVLIHLKPDAKNWLFEEFRMGKRIFVGVRTLERLWGYY